MALSDTQIRQLKSKLEPKHVKTRKANGADLHYVEGWHVIAEANRIFGYDAWDRRTLSTACIWQGASGQDHGAAYTAKVRVSVRAGDITIVREGSGTGEAKATTPGKAHELALKGAETDATKRALATFGNPFGLALYDPEQTGVRRSKAAEAAKEPWTLRDAEGNSVGTYPDAKEFAGALRHEMEKSPTIELLFAVWEQNVATVRAASYALKRNGNKTDKFAKELLTHLKSCASALVKLSTESVLPNVSSDRECQKAREKIDKSVLTISEPKRHRSKEHLRFVAQQPCLICGRSPSQAHHIRYAQPKGLSLKVSDEFTVPLCAIHHSENHMTSDEWRWWKEHKIDPLSTAESLWKESHNADGYPQNRQ